MENVLCGIRQPGICVLVQTTCHIHFTTCAAKHDVCFTIFCACSHADHVCHRTAAGQVQQRCHIALQHHLPSWPGWIWCSHLPLTLQMDNNSYTRQPKAQVTLHFFLFSMTRMSFYSVTVYYRNGLCTQPFISQHQIYYVIRLAVK